MRLVYDDNAQMRVTCPQENLLAIKEPTRKHGLDIQIEINGPWPSCEMGDRTENVIQHHTWICFKST